MSVASLWTCTAKIVIGSAGRNSLGGWADVNVATHMVWDGPHHMSSQMQHLAVYCASCGQKLVLLGEHVIVSGRHNTSVRPNPHKLNFSNFSPVKSLNSDRCMVPDLYFQLSSSLTRVLYCFSFWTADLEITDLTGSTPFNFDQIIRILIKSILTLITELQILQKLHCVSKKVPTF